MSTTFKVVNGDIAISDASGQPQTVADAAKLRQDLRGALSTAVRRDNVGAGLDDLIGKTVDIHVLRADLTARVRSSIARMQDLQSRYGLNQRPLTERISRLVRLDVIAMDSAVTAHSFRVEVATVAGPPQVFNGALS